VTISTEIDSAANVKGERFASKRDAFIDVASDIMCEKGIVGMTLAEVCGQLAMTTPSILHYFRRKEDLATACLLSAITRIDFIVVESLKAERPEDKIKDFVLGYFKLFKSVKTKSQPPLAPLSEVKTLLAQDVGSIRAAYGNMVMRLRTIFSDPAFGFLDSNGRTLRTMYLFFIVSWTGAWIGKYDPNDYEHLGQRLCDILLNGLAAHRDEWSPATLAGLAKPCPPSAARPLAKDTFLFAATQLINEEGYRGASVDKIAARLNVTKGAIYHQKKAKDDLVVECFDRTFHIVERAQRLGMESPGTGWMQLLATSYALVAFQLSNDGPLLSNSALTAAPENIRDRLSNTWTQTCDRYAIMVSNGIVDGSIRTVDAAVAAQFLHIGLNSAGDLPDWMPDVDVKSASDLYLKPMLTGILF
jgi:AcrR family transcriptional regulator